MQQAELFSPADWLPEGLVYQDAFLPRECETDLLQMISTLPLREAQYKEWTAKRRIISFGGSYDFNSNELKVAAPLPEWLKALRTAIAEWSGVPAHDFNHAMIAEYQVGTQLGWHRDVPDFETIVGVSLAGPARMRLRPYPPQAGKSRETQILKLPPRSIYMLSAAARWRWQHAISPTKCVRYSITFRTLRQ